MASLREQAFQKVIAQNDASKLGEILPHPLDDRADKIAQCKKINDLDENFSCLVNIHEYELAGRLVENVSDEENTDTAAKQEIIEFLKGKYIKLSNENLYLSAKLGLLPIFKKYSSLLHSLHSEIHDPVLENLLSFDDGRVPNKIRLNVIKYLVDQKFITEDDKSKYPIVFLASQTEENDEVKLSQVKQLLEMGFSLKITQVDEYDPLLRAISEEKLPMVQLLLQYYDIEDYGESSEYYSQAIELIGRSIYRRDNSDGPKIVKMLIEKGFSLDHQNLLDTITSMLDYPDNITKIGFNFMFLHRNYQIINLLMRRGVKIVPIMKKLLNEKPTMLLEEDFLDYLRLLLTKIENVNINNFQFT